MATTRLVIFDFDGVLANSEIIALYELGKCFASFGISLDEDELVSRFLGASFNDIVRYITDRTGAFDDEAFRAQWYGSLFSRYEHELTLMPGAGDLLDGLDTAGIRYCIASGGSVRRLEFAMGVLDLVGRFDGAAFSADLVGAGKPAPDLFLYAARKMDIEINKCLVVEDATAGVDAARTAQIRCLGFVGGDHLTSRRDQHAELLLARGAEAIARELPEVLDHL